MADPLLIEGTVHHIDILDDLASGSCTSAYAKTWRPRWAEYAGDTQALITLNYDNGVKAFHEGAVANAATLNNWGNEYFRAECELATIILDKRRVHRYPHGAEPASGVGPDEQEEIPLKAGDRWARDVLIDDFISWLDGGPPVETEVAANLESLSIVFAAIESSLTGAAVDPRRLLERARERH